MCCDSTDIENELNTDKNVETETKVLLKSTTRSPGHTAYESNDHTSKPTIVRSIVPAYRRNNSHPTNCRE